MPKLVFKNVIGQPRVVETFEKAIENDKLGHAYLFSGEAGVGKFQVALELGMALLCEDLSQVPCRKCESCRKVMHHAHPGFHMAMPVCLRKEHRGSESKLNTEGWAYLDNECIKRIADPYVLTETSDIPLIPVEWMREINHAIVRGSVDSRRNVAILCGIDQMNKESANAMLKTLEEPPANTIIILTTERPQAVLPTILSRCQLQRFGYIGSEEMRSALTKRMGEKADAARIRAAVGSAQGSLGKAIQLLEQPVDECIANAKQLLSLATSSDWHDVAPKLDILISEQFDAGRDYGTVERVLLYVMYVLRDSFLHGKGITEKYIRTDYIAEIAPGEMGLSEIAAINGECQRAISAIRARGNVQMVLVTWLMSVMEILNVKK